MKNKAERRDFHERGTQDGGSSYELPHCDRSGLRDSFCWEIVKALKEFLADEELEEVIEELQRSLEKEVVV